MLTVWPGCGGGLGPATVPCPCTDEMMAKRVTAAMSAADLEVFMMIFVVINVIVKLQRVEVVCCS